MSQSSGLLTEDEIRNYLNEHLGLKLDRDSLLKPTKDIFEVYLKLMDDIGCKWRKPIKSTVDSEEYNLKIMLARWIRHLVERYNIGFSFQLSDILNPTRRRTTAFLNVLVYLREQVQEQVKLIGQLFEEREIYRALADKVINELSQKRLELEELAIKKARSKESMNSNKEKRIKFEELKRNGEILAEEARQAKNQIKTQAEKNDKRKQQVENCEKELEELDKTLSLLNEGRGSKERKKELQRSITSENEQIKVCLEIIEAKKEKILAREKLIRLKQMNNERFAREVDYTNSLISGEKKDKISLGNKLENVQAANARWLENETEIKDHSLFNAERTKTKKKLQYKIKEEQVKLELEKSKAETNELVQTYDKQIQDLQEGIATARKERLKVSDEHTLKSNLCTTYIEKANKQLESLSKLCTKVENLESQVDSLKSW